MSAQSQVITEMIRNGQLDGDFDAIYDAIRVRRAYLDAQAALSIQPGMYVQTDDGIRPEWMAGKYGVVTENKGKGKVEVTLFAYKSWMVEAVQGLRTMESAYLMRRGQVARIIVPASMLTTGA